MAEKHYNFIKNMRILDNLEIISEKLDGQYLNKVLQISILINIENFDRIP